MTPIEIDPAACRIRQARLLEIMQRKASRLGDHPAAGAHPVPDWPAVPLDFSTPGGPAADGHAILVAPENRLPERHAADEVHGYVARWHSTLRNDQCAGGKSTFFRRRSKPAGPASGGESNSAALRSILRNSMNWSISNRTSIEFVVARMPTSWRRLRAAIEATKQMYERARAIIQPGINELDVFNELQIGRRAVPGRASDGNRQRLPMRLTRRPTARSLCGSGRTLHSRSRTRPTVAILPTTPARWRSREPSSRAA